MDWSLANEFIRKYSEIEYKYLYRKQSGQLQDRQYKFRFFLYKQHGKY